MLRSRKYDNVIKMREYDDNNTLLIGHNKQYQRTKVALAESLFKC